MEQKMYSKSDIKAAARFKAMRDVVEALLKDGELYSIEEVEEIIKKFMEGCV